LLHIKANVFLVPAEREPIDQIKMGRGLFRSELLMLNYDIRVSNGVVRIIK
jgi:hypothetical protein